MLQAILSDVHGNLEALTAVLRDIEMHDVDEIICLGDLIGYGPDALACLQLRTQREITSAFDHRGLKAGAV
ncbi:metallophosphoesterase [Anatilimnocola sp. NA78]|uniref:metallophosphoesterase family protein n=1 Tax=Anatilimnocola sp. NA78 TaxID=3415683 RepID=UPI003CE4687E